MIFAARHFLDSEALTLFSSVKLFNILKTTKMFFQKQEILEKFPAEISVSESFLSEFSLLS